MPKSRRSEAIWIEARNRWQLNAQRDGKRKTFTSSIPGRRGKHEAEAKADDWLDAGQPEDLRFDSAWAIFLDHLSNTTGKANWADYESIGRNWLLPALARKHTSDIAMRHIQDIINDAANQGRSARTCKNIKDKFFSFVSYAEDQKWIIDAGKSKKVKVSKKARKGKRQIAQPEQLKRLFSIDTETCRGIVRPCFFIHAFRVIALTGLRRGELCAIRPEDIQGNVINVSRSVNRMGIITDGKTENAQRRVPITSRTRLELDAQQKMLESLGIQSEWLFPDGEGEILDSNVLYNHWRRYANEHEITATLHELRHTFVSITANDMPAPLLKRVVGHSPTMDTFGVYGHAVDGELIHALNLMEETFSRILE